MFLIEALNLILLEVIFNTFKEEIGECRDTLKLYLMIFQELRSLPDVLTLAYDV